MITKESVEAAERRIAEAERGIVEDRALVAQYNEQISQNLHEELSDILNRCNVMGFPNIVVNEVFANIDANLSHTSDYRRFTIELQCTSFRD